MHISILLFRNIKCILYNSQDTTTISKHVHKYIDAPFRTLKCLVQELLNWPKKVNAVQTEGLLQFFLPVSPFALFIFSKNKIERYPSTFCTHNLPCYECSGGHLTYQVTCYIPLITITCPKHALHPWARKQSTINYWHMF